MNDWHFFATVFTEIEGLIQTGGNALLNGSIAYVRPVLLVGVIMWVAAHSIAVANGFAPMNSLYRGIFRAAVIVSVVQSVGTYNQYVGDVSLFIPTEIGNALGSGGGTNVATGAAFDAVWNQAAHAGLLVWKHIPAYSLSGAIMTLCVSGYFIVALACIAAGFLVYLASTSLLILLIKVGPLFVALYVFPITQRLTMGWISAVLASILTQVFSVAILVLLIGSEQATVARIIAGASNGAAPNFIDELLVLLEAGLMMWLISVLVKQAPNIASGISGGVYHNVSNFTHAAFSAPSAIGASVRGVGGVVGNGVGMAATKAGNVGRAAMANRASSSTGRSLSGG